MYTAVIGSIGSPRSCQPMLLLLAAEIRVPRNHHSQGHTPASPPAAAVLHLCLQDPTGPGRHCCCCCCLEVLLQASALECVAGLQQTNTRRESGKTLKGPYVCRVSSLLGAGMGPPVQQQNIWTLTGASWLANATAESPGLFHCVS
jgi:hypothetical protein